MTANRPGHKLILYLIMALCCLAAAPGCKKAAQLLQPEEKPEVKKPLPWYKTRFIAFYRKDENTGALQIWRMNADGSDQELLAELDNPKQLSPADMGPGRSIMVYNKNDFILYYTYDKALFRYDPHLKQIERVRDVSSVHAGGVDWLWFIRDHKKMIAHCADPDTKNSEPEYVQIDLKTGGQGRITPGDAEWSDYDFLNKEDFYFLDAPDENDRFPSPAGADAWFAFESGGGAGTWPALVAHTSGGAQQITDGMQRVLSARWTPSGKAIAFVVEEETAPYSRGRIFHADPESGTAKPVSTAKFRFDILLNMSAEKDFIFFHEPDQGVVSYNFESDPAVIAENATYPYLFEIKK